MSTGYSVPVNDWNDEQWEMTGRDLMYSKMTEKGTSQHKEAKKRAKDCSCDFEDVVHDFADEHVPMMLYAYPLEFEPSDEKIIEVCERTNCTVVQNTETDEYFLALCGGGMDLSQDIALAYNIVQKWLPISLLSGVSSQRGLSKAGKDFDQVKNIIIEQSKMEAERLKENIKKWESE